MSKKGQRVSPATEFKPGVSGNPGGKPLSKPITAAYNKILAMPADEFRAFKPATVAEMKALEMVMARGAQLTPAMREISDRVEGTVDRHTTISGPDGGAIPIAHVIVDLTPAQLEDRRKKLLTSVNVGETHQLPECIPSITSDLADTDPLVLDVEVVDEEPKDE